MGDEHADGDEQLAGTLRATATSPAPVNFQERVLELSRSSLGEEHPGTLRAMNNLALTLHTQGDVAGPAHCRSGCSS